MSFCSFYLKIVLSVATLCESGIAESSVIMSLICYSLLFYVLLFLLSKNKLPSLGEGRGVTVTHRNQVH